MARRAFRQTGVNFRSANGAFVKYLFVVAVSPLLVVHLLIREHDPAIRTYLGIIRYHLTARRTFIDNITVPRNEELEVQPGVETLFDGE